MRDVDVLVVGAGPAGATTAIALRTVRPDLSVALMDRSWFPRDKACGDGLGPGVVSLCKQLGLARIFDGQKPATEIRVFGPDGTVVHQPVPTVGGRTIEGYVIPRRVFDERLVDAAVDVGAEPVLGHRCTSVTSTADGWRVDAHTRTGDVGVRCRVLIGADGAYSQIRRQLGHPRLPDHKTIVALRAYASCDNYGDVETRTGPMQFEYLKALLPAYAWVFPAGKSVLNIGVGIVLRDLKRGNVHLKDSLQEYADVLRHRGLHLSELREQRAHHLPLAGALTSSTHGRVALVGDAAGMINPLTGEGIYYGMVSGAMMARALEPVDLNDGTATQRAVRRYEAAYKRRFRAHLRSNQLAQHLMRWPAWTTAALRAAGREESVARDAIEMMFADGRLRPLTAWKILRHGRK